MIPSTTTVKFFTSLGNSLSQTPTVCIILSTTAFQACTRTAYKVLPTTFKYVDCPKFKPSSFHPKTVWSASLQQHPNPGANFCTNYFSVAAIKHNEHMKLVVKKLSVSRGSWFQKDQISSWKKMVSVAARAGNGEITSPLTGSWQREWTRNWARLWTPKACSQWLTSSHKSHQPPRTTPARGTVFKFLNVLRSLVFTHPLAMWLVLHTFPVVSLLSTGSYLAQASFGLIV